MSSVFKVCYLTVLFYSVGPNPDHSKSLNNHLMMQTAFQFPLCSSASPFALQLGWMCLILANGP